MSRKYPFKATPTPARIKAAQEYVSALEDAVSRELSALRDLMLSWGWSEAWLNPGVAPAVRVAGVDMARPAMVGVKS